MHCNNRIQYANNRLCQWRNLLFLAVLLSSGCTTCNPNPHWNIRWKEKKAIAIDVPYNLANGVDKDSIGQVIKFVLQGDQNNTPIIGTYTFNREQFSFEPAIPFTNGLTYEVYARDKKIFDFSIDTPPGSPPEVTAIYPKIDTIPENLLKIYIQFSQPMEEGKSAAFVSMINKEGDTLKNIFLDLQPELWNEDRTVLTLWLDPGRIKRDLQPNLKLGNPLHRQNVYKLCIAKGWRNTQGQPILMDYTRPYTTIARNENSPDPSKWRFTSPPAASKEALFIFFDKPLDHFLLNECLWIENASQKKIKGKIESFDNDRQCRFIPQDPWVAGEYLLVINTKLEDLSGNNINRPFDRDVTKTKTPSTDMFRTVKFKIN